MIGLLYKDHVSMFRAYAKNLLLIVVVYTLLAVALKINFFAFATIFFGGMYATSSLQLDETSHWNIYARTMPLSDFAYVGAKYLLGLLWLFGGVVLGSVQLLLYSLLTPQSAEDICIIVLSIFVTAGISLAYFALSFVLSFKFGATKARTTVMMLCAVLFCGTMFFANYAQKNKISPPPFLSKLMTMELMLGDAILVGVVILGAAALFFFVCFLISVSIYKKKEF